jgi:hypothetical protein
VLLLVDLDERNVPGDTDMKADMEGTRGRDGRRDVEVGRVR